MVSEDAGTIQIIQVEKQEAEVPVDITFSGGEYVHVCVCMCGACVSVCVYVSLFAIAKQPEFLVYRQNTGYGMSVGDR